jgi:hypothetical protein
MSGEDASELLHRDNIECDKPKRCRRCDNAQRT